MTKCQYLAVCDLDKKTPNEYDHHDDCMLDDPVGTAVTDFLTEKKTMRQRISEKNIFPVFDVYAEYRKLAVLFHEEKAFGHRYDYGNGDTNLSYRDVLEDIFLDWDLKGTFTSVKEMLSGLGISEQDMKCDASEDRLLDYIQFVINACPFVLAYVRNQSRNYYHDPGERAFNSLSDLSHLLLNRLGAEVVDEAGELCVRYKDDIATVVAEQNDECRGSIVEYLKIDNRGDLTRKEEILCTLAKKLEAHDKQFHGTEFSSLCSDTTALLNNLGPRHSLDENNNIKRKALEMCDVEREKWYDRTFQMFLACMAAVPYLEFRKEIKDLKRDVG